MNTNFILHALRNPYGISESKLREVRLEAADKIEQLTDAYKNMCEFAEKNGLNITTSAIKYPQECGTCRKCIYAIRAESVVRDDFYINN